MTANRGRVRYLRVLALAGVGAAVLGSIYGFHVGVLALACVCVGVHIGDLEQNEQKRSPPDCCGVGSQGSKEQPEAQSVQVAEKQGRQGEWE